MPGPYLDQLDQGPWVTLALGVGVNHLIDWLSDPPPLSPPPSHAVIPASSQGWEPVESTRVLNRHQQMCPRVSPGNVWRCFWLSQLGEGVILRAFSGRRPGMLLSILTAQDAPTGLGSASPKRQRADSETF